MFVTKQLWCCGADREHATLADAITYAKQKGFDCGIYELDGKGLKHVGSWSVFQGFVEVMQ